MDGPGARATDAPDAPDGDAAHVNRLYERIYAVARAIPRGRVATYGQVAELAGMPGAARVAGAAMRASLPAAGLPWQRVVGKRGRGVAQVSIHDPVGAGIQRALLEEEGVCFSASGGISLRAYGWLPEEAPGPGQARAAGRKKATARPRGARRGTRGR